MSETDSMSGIVEIIVECCVILATMLVLFRALRNILPSVCLRSLITAVEDLDGLYNHSLESGFMSDADATTIRGQVLALHARTDALRFRVMKATTFREDLVHALRGLSREISEAVREVRALCGKISAVSLENLVAQQRQQLSSGDNIVTGGGEAIPPYYCVPAIVVAEHNGPTDPAIEKDTSVVSP